MTNTSTRSPLPLVTFLLLAIVALSTIATVWHSTPAHATEAVCSTDLDCAAHELQAALYTGADVAEDLSFTPGTAVYEDGSSRSGEPMSELYAAKNDLLADAFWAAHAGEDWADVEQHLPAWLDAYRSA